MNHKLDIYGGLNLLLSGPLFKGVMNNNTEEEYDALEWLDDRPKPTWTDVYLKATNRLRRAIADTLNNKTNDIITYGFRYSAQPEVEIWATQEWQFDVLVVVISRDMFSYPYYLKASENEDTSTNYITIHIADEFLQFQTEYLTHVATALAIGRQLKDSLSTLTVAELEEFEDVRVSPTHADID